ncbi:MAG: hypothetical protein EPO40_18655 [Myxococcaceae bacterium]|nr:MAG: hypothetical protein EPO40_18655 [Myxococcaceae bacterium]
MISPQRIARQSGRIVAGLLAGVISSWSYIEPLSAMVQLPAGFIRWTIPALAIAYAIWRMRPRTHLELRGPNNLRVHLSFGDVFTQKNTDTGLAIPTDDFFLTKNKKFVTPGMLISQLKQKRFNNSDDFDTKVLEATEPLRDHFDFEARDFPKELEGRTRQWPLGSTAVLQVDGTYYFFTASCKIDLQSSPPSGRATPPELFKALLGLWQAITKHPSGKPVVVPLFGAGQTGTGLRPTEALHIMLVSLVCAARATPISDEIRIVIHDSHQKHIDLDDDVLKGIMHAE